MFLRFVVTLNDDYDKRRRWRHLGVFWGVLLLWWCGGFCGEGFEGLLVMVGGVVEGREGGEGGGLKWWRGWGRLVGVSCGEEEGIVGKFLSRSFGRDGGLDWDV